MADIKDAKAELEHKGLGHWVALRPHLPSRKSDAFELGCGRTDTPQSPLDESPWRHVRRGR
jgi:hypothetical protein